MPAEQARQPLALGSDDSLAVEGEGNELQADPIGREGVQRGFSSGHPLTPRRRCGNYKRREIAFGVSSEGARFTVSQTDNEALNALCFQGRGQKAGVIGDAPEPQPTADEGDAHEAAGSGQVSPPSERTGA